MSKKIRKIISASTAVSVFLFSLALPNKTHVIADNETPTTTVTVGNDAPDIGVAYENPASTAAAPTNVGSNVTFYATSTDSNGDAFWLAICKGPNVTPGTAGAAPSCPDGEWAISSATTTSGGTANVAYTVQGSDTQESYNWYAFTCDTNSGGALCSATSTGSGDSGSPFYVNHAPTFSAVSNDGPKAPGATDLTITASTYTETDTGDTVSLYVCKSSGFTAGGSPGCTGDTWCSATGVDAGNTLACDLEIPNPQPHGNLSYWPYVVDGHGMAATGAAQGAEATFAVSNALPTASSVSLNGGSTITLTNEKSTNNISVTAVISDDNSCQDITASTTANVWLTSVGSTGCDQSGEAHGNNCYYHAVCAYTSGCDDASDPAANYTCTVPFQYYANPTDSGTPWSTDSWTATVIPGDGDGENAAGAANSSAVALESFLALGLATSYDAIAYGSVSAGSYTDPLLEKTRVEATGNCALDVNLSGTTMTGPGTAIPVANQRYGAGDTAPSWASVSSNTLSTSPTPFGLEVCKSGYTAAPEWKRLWWGIEIPAGQTAGAYTGQNTISAVKDGWTGAGEWCES